jgi:hypothetical protein
MRRGDDLVELQPGLSGGKGIGRLGPWEIAFSLGK